jgi:putative glutathione S-transferase
MGAFIDGVWHRQDHFPTDTRGAFKRAASQFRSAISTDGSTQFPWEPGRYVLYVSHACPWCHRVSIVRSLYGLTDVLPMAVVDPYMTGEGWHFSDGPGVVRDPVFDLQYVRELYVKADPHYTGRCTVPILWDTKTGTIVCNESKEIIRMLDAVRVAEGSAEITLAPAGAIEASDRWRDANYEPINNGVYRSGFARSQEAYDEAVEQLFAQLDRLEEHLAANRYLCGDVLTEADVCLFVTLYRFDPVYVTHFKCNRRRLVDYPNLWGFTRELYQLPGVAETCDLDHIRQHYYRSHESLNPSRVVATGFLPDYGEAHGRG